MSVVISGRTETRLDLGSEHPNWFLGRLAFWGGVFGIVPGGFCVFGSSVIGMRTGEAGPLAALVATIALLIGGGYWLRRRQSPRYWFDRARGEFGVDWWDAFRLRRSERWAWGELKRVELTEGIDAEADRYRSADLRVLLTGGRWLEIERLGGYEAEVAALGTFFGDTFTFHPLRS